MKNSEESLRDVWNTIKWTNIHIMGIPEGESDKRTKNLFKDIMAGNFSNTNVKCCTFEILVQFVMGLCCFNSNNAFLIWVHLKCYTLKKKGQLHCKTLLAKHNT